MERIIRKPFQGVTNIIRFNWHYYFFAFLFITLLVVITHITNQFHVFLSSAIIISGIVLTISMSLAVSYYIYDCSVLYSFSWLPQLEVKHGSRIVNINAGFDETSALLNHKYPDAELLVFDFYDPVKHTEVSIERARKMYPRFPGTISITTDAVPLKEQSVDVIFLILAAHEIRDQTERELFFRQLKASLKDSGKVIVVEHRRDLANFIAFNFGFFHFYSRERWKKSFISAGLVVESEIKITPFISAFILINHGTTP